MFPIFGSCPGRFGTESALASITVATGDVNQLKARIKRLEQEITRLIDAIATVGASDALAERLRASEREYQSLKESLVEQAERVALPDIKTIF